MGQQETKQAPVEQQELGGGGAPAGQEDMGLEPVGHHQETGRS